MKADLYTKAVLTTIAGLLAWHAVASLTTSEVHAEGIYYMPRVFPEGHDGTENRRLLESVNGKLVPVRGTVVAITCADCYEREKKNYVGL